MSFNYINILFEEVILKLANYGS